MGSHICTQGEEDSPISPHNTVFCPSMLVDVLGYFDEMGCARHYFDERAGNRCHCCAYESVLEILRFQRNGTGKDEGGLCGEFGQGQGFKFEWKVAQEGC